MQEQPEQLHVHVAFQHGVHFAEIVYAVRQSVERIIAHYDCLPAMIQVSEGIPTWEPGTKRRRVQRRIP